MEFFIKKGANLPAIRLLVVQDGRSDYVTLMETLVDSKVFFSMANATTGIPKIALAPCEIIPFYQPDGTIEYYINFKFSNRDTNKPGRYKGEFIIQNPDGTRILPLREEIFINVQDTFVSIDNCCTDTIRDFNSLVLIVEVFYGSVDIVYTLTSFKPVPVNIRVDFTNTFYTYIGSPLVVTTGVTINAGNTVGTTYVSFPDEDGNNLTRNATISNIVIIPSQLADSYTITEEIIFPTPTPTPSITPEPTVTPTNTETPTPTPTITPTETEQIITDAILTNNGDYISVGDGIYLKFIDPTPNPTPTTTKTPTPTPTQTEQVITDAILTNDGDYIEVGNGIYLMFINPTPLPTITPTPTNTETPTNTPTNTETPTNTPTNTETPTNTPTNTKTPTQTPTVTHTQGYKDGLTPQNAGDNACQIKTYYPSSPDGLYWIKNDNISGGTPFQIYADMTTDGGGWTLLVVNQLAAGWTHSNALLLNEFNPVISGSNYSIVGYADYLKGGGSFQYMMEANQRNHYGGIWTAPSQYSFVNTGNTQTGVTLDIKFGTWEYSDTGIEERMPWYPAEGPCPYLTTSYSDNDQWWGTLITRDGCGFNPAPWIAGQMQDPGIIWYWVRGCVPVEPTPTPTQTQTQTPTNTPTPTCYVAPPSVVGSMQCGWAVPTAFASGGGSPIYYWYDTPTGGVAIVKNNINYPYYLSSTTTFYVSSVLDGVCESERVPATCSVEPVDSITATTTTYETCTGNTITLGVNISDVYGTGYNHFDWSVTPSVGGGFNSSTGTSETTIIVSPTEPGTYIYSVTGTSATFCTSVPEQSTNVTVIVYPQPYVDSVVISGVTSEFFCVGNTYDISLSATGENVETYVWYSEQFGSLSGQSQVVSVNFPNTDLIPIGLTAYSLNNVCYWTRTEFVNATPTPVAPTTNASEQCGYQIPTCSVSSNNAGDVHTFNWYNEISGGTLLQSSTANTYSNYISATTTLYVTEITPYYGCESTRVPVIITVNPPDAITYSASSQSISLGQSFDVVISAQTDGVNTFSLVTISGTPETGSGVIGAESMPTSGSNPIITNPYTITPTLSGTYSYLVLAYDFDKVCTSLITFSVEVT